eukprot:1507087-Pyramimonas_sp.AAC.1
MVIRVGAMLAISTWSYGKISGKSHQTLVLQRLVLSGFLRTCQEAGPSTKESCLPYWTGNKSADYFERLGADCHPREKSNAKLRKMREAAAPLTLK